MKECACHTFFVYAQAGNYNRARPGAYAVLYADCDQGGG